MRKHEKGAITPFQSAANVVTSQLHEDRSRRRWPSILQVGSWSSTGREKRKKKKKPEPSLYPPVETVVDLPLIDIDHLFLSKKRPQFQPKSNSRRSMTSLMRHQWHQKSTSLRSLLSTSQKSMSGRLNTKITTMEDHADNIIAHDDFPIAEIVTFSSGNDSCSTLGQELVLLQPSSFDIDEEFPTASSPTEPTATSMLEIEVAPGVFRPFRGAMETMLAIRSGHVVEIICACCQTWLLCVRDAEYCLCPDCRVISPIESQEPSNEGGGISLGCAKSSLSTTAGVSSSSSTWKGQAATKQQRHKNGEW